MSETEFITTDQPNESLFLVARDKQEMVQANLQLVSWLGGKLASIKANEKELEEAVEHARMRKWATKPLKSQLSLVRRQGIYYQKLKAAVEAGYTLVPLPWQNEEFAIRVKRTRATERTFSSKWEDGAAIPEQKTDSPPLGDGRWVSPQSEGEHWEETRENDEGKKVPKYFAASTDFAEVAFPLMAAKPELMNATAEAMALKMFDKIVISPGLRGRDPLILGVVNGPGTKEQAFLIAWYLDVRGM